METPNGNPIASILPGLPNLKHRDSVIVMFRTGVNAGQLQQLLSHKFYPLADGEVDINFAVGTSCYSGKMPPLDEVVQSLARKNEHPGVIKPEYQDGSDDPVPKDGYMPFITLSIMPYQQSRLSVLETYTTNIYIVSAGAHHLLFEHYRAMHTRPTTAPYPQIDTLTFPASIGRDRLHTGNLIFNDRLGQGLPLNHTSLWLSLQHQFKTGMLLSMCASIPLFNPVKDGHRRGVVFVTAEESHEHVIAALYKYAQWIFDGVIPEVDMIDRQAHINREGYLVGLFADRGWDFSFIRRSPMEGLNPNDLRAQIENLSKEGIRVELVAVDNLHLLTGPLGRGKALLRELGNIRRTYGFHLAATNYLSPDAKAAMRKYSDPKQWLTDMAVEGQYDVILAKEADTVYLHHVVNEEGPQVVIKPAGFAAGKPLFMLPLTPGGYTHLRA